MRMEKENFTVWWRRREYTFGQGGTWLTLVMLKSAKLFCLYSTVTLARKKRHLKTP